MTLKYHPGQIEVQSEANTRRVADMLASWVGPVTEFCATADMIILATEGARGRLGFMAVSGQAPVVEVAGPSTVLVPLGGTEAPSIEGTVSAGGLALNLAMARRARLNGLLSREGDTLRLEATETFTNCRKYVAPSAPVETALHFGPVSRSEVTLDDHWLARTVGSAETSFLASISPDGIVDVSHRGGPPGFLRLDPPAARLEWDEYVGDGMLKSAGNIRATGRFSLLVPDLTSGDAVELSGTASVRLLRRDKRPRTEGLQQHREDFPVQGYMSCTLEAAFRLTALMNPRRRLEKRQRVTSASPIGQQAPQ
ncbi:MAG TPA: pyridoxamine 5'-phosphate oxidase family protein [Dehalococcoidia bacterium]|nr:pyridoxamine 5'-phosphate oxidase family protein [Dehalococcoidia bacterium]